MKKITVILLAVAGASFLFGGCERTIGPNEAQQTQIFVAPDVYGMFSPIPCPRHDNPPHRLYRLAFLPQG